MTYEEYEKARRVLIEEIIDNTCFTQQYFEKLQESLKKEKIFENKINQLAEDYLSIIQDDFPKEKKKEIDIIQYGYYAILDYCLKRIKQNDKNLTTGFSIKEEVENEN